jgi:hypothetical protein
VSNIHCELHINANNFLSQFCFLADYIVMYIPIARQRVGKHIAETQANATIGHPLLGNGPVTHP